MGILTPDWAQVRVAIDLLSSRLPFFRPLLGRNIADDSTTFMPRRTVLASSSARASSCVNKCSGVGRPEGAGRASACLAATEGREPARRFAVRAASA